MVSISGGEPLTLYIDAFWQSPFDIGCYVTLREKGLPFGIATALVREGHGVVDNYREQVIIARVPALQHGQFWLSESLAIIEYLEEAFPPPAHPSVLPRGGRDRARARQVMMWIRTGLRSLRRDRPAYHIFYRTPFAPLQPDALRDVAELFDVATRLLSSPANHLFGAWSIADVDLAFVLMRLIRTGHDVPARLREYAELTFQRPSVKQYVEHARPPHPPL